MGHLPLNSPHRPNSGRDNDPKYIEETHMKHTVRLAVLGTVTALLSACGTMGLDKTATQADWGKGSVVMMSVNMNNEYRPSYGATRLGVVVHKVKSDDARSVIMVSETVADGKTDAVLAQQVAPGSYSIKTLYGGSFKFPIVGSIDFSVNAPFEVSSKTVVYLGHISLVNREKLDPDDQATGSAIPLIDQAVSGFSGGTLQVSLMDHFDQDTATFKREYPAFQNASFVRAPLAQMSIDRKTGSSAPKIVVKLDSKVIVAETTPSSPAQ